MSHESYSNKELGALRCTPCYRLQLFPHRDRLRLYLNIRLCHQVFDHLKLDPQFLNVDSLDVHAVSHICRWQTTLFQIQCSTYSEQTNVSTFRSLQQPIQPDGGFGTSGDFSQNRERDRWRVFRSDNKGYSKIFRYLILLICNKLHRIFLLRNGRDNGVYLYHVGAP